MHEWNPNGARRRSGFGCLNFPINVFYFVDTRTEFVPLDLPVFRFGNINYTNTDPFSKAQLNAVLEVFP